MKVAVMQPYLFPYLGYYQLVCASDIFVLYDDVTFIKQGYINRNHVLMHGQPTRITIPVPGASSNKRIRDLAFSSEVEKPLKTLSQAYSKAPFFPEVYPIIEQVLRRPERDIATVCQSGITEAFKYLGIEKETVRSSELSYERDQPPAERLVSICRTLGSSDYVNSIGGQKLYSKEAFHAMGCRLSFLQMREITYRQGNDKFVPNLSMIDVLMWCDKAKVRELLQAYTLV